MLIDSKEFIVMEALPQQNFIKKMKIILKQRVAVMATLFIGLISFAQEENIKPKNEFEVFKEYSNFGIILSPRVQFKSNSNTTLGNDPFIHNAGFTGGVGLNYIFRPEKTWSYRMGIHYNFNNETNFNLKESSNNITFKSSTYSFSIPIEAEYKKQLFKNMIWTTKGGINITFINRFDSASTSFDDFSLIYEPVSDGVYTNLTLSSGFYFIFKPFILQTSLIYQKNIPAFLKGEFTTVNSNNLIQNQGTYKTSGDFIGLELIIYPRFKKNNN